MYLCYVYRRVWVGGLSSLTGTLRGRSTAHGIDMKLSSDQRGRPCGSRETS